MSETILYHYAASGNSRATNWIIQYLGLDVKVNENKYLLSRRVICNSYLAGKDSESVGKRTIS